jgi:type I restriction-modification system DNA methylase subunit
MNAATPPPPAPVADPAAADQAAFEDAFQRTCALCATFAAGESRYLSPPYQEAEVRKDFIDKLFIALGWDVNHDRQTNPYEQEVKVESPVNAGGPRRADYAFHLHPQYKVVRFFVEAKKPFGEIATAQNYFQVNRYGWNAGTPLAVLTDFEQFHVIDCRGRPDIEHSIHRGVARYHYRELLEREKFAQLYWLFSREAVAAGSLEKRAQELPRRRGKAVQRGLFHTGDRPVDEDFLEQLDQYREALAKAFKKHHTELDSEALTEITQRVLDRIVFMRFLEDKGIEGRRFVETFGDRGSAWQDFLAASRRLDGIYNGIVFKPHPLFDRPGFTVDEEAFADVCEDISRADSPYDFNNIPIHILGSIYERFLGRVIVATDKRAKVEDKPEVRKAGGVFYTPEYIVTYIVENTVGKLIAGKSPAQVAGLHFADIACGSGSFLLGIYDLLLRHYSRWFNDHPDRAEKAGCIRHEDGTWHLTLAQRRQILVNNVYGVDIDHQACEVAQLSLYLKLLEEETTASAHGYQLEFKETLLPSLGRNIVCGNSLVGRDILTDQLFAGDEERKLNPMDFADAFPDVFRPQAARLKAREAATGDVFALEGEVSPAIDATYTRARKPAEAKPIEVGFDAIVGNPPYVRMEAFKPIKNYLRSTYQVHEERADLYSYFIEREHQLLREGGRFGMIVSNKFLRSNYGRPIRDFLGAHAQIDTIADFAGLPVFKGATVRTIVLLTTKSAGGNATALRYAPPPAVADFERLETGHLTVDALVQQSAYEVGADALGAEGWNFPRRATQLLLEQLNVGSTPLAIYAKGQICRGIVSGLADAFVIDAETRSRIVQRNAAAAEIIKPYLGGREVRRYAIKSAGQFLVYTYHDVPIAKYPAVVKHLEPFREKLNQRATKQAWYELQQPQLKFAPLMDRPKLVFPDIATEPRFCLDESGAYGSNTTYFIARKDLALLGVLNSKAAFFFFKTICAGLEGKGDVYLRFFGQYLETFPVPTFGARQAELEKLVDLMLQTRKQAAAATTEKDRTYYENKCVALDGQIDRLVYALYGLDEDEIALIESETAR